MKSMNPPLRKTAFFMTVILCLSTSLSSGDSWLTETENGWTRIVKVMDSGLRVIMSAEPTNNFTKTRTTLIDQNGHRVHIAFHSHIGSTQQVRTAAATGIIPLATSGDQLSEIGTLNLIVGLSQPTMNNKGQIAFYSGINDNVRNQAIIVADINGLHPIVFGCGDGGGGVDPGPPNCGTVTPVGGTFSGLFGGTTDAPDINEQGDVLS